MPKPTATQLPKGNGSTGYRPGRNVSPLRPVRQKNRQPRHQLDPQSRPVNRGSASAHPIASTANCIFSPEIGSSSIHWPAASIKLNDFGRPVASRSKRVVDSSGSPKSSGQRSNISIGSNSTAGDTVVRSARWACQTFQTISVSPSRVAFMSDLGTDLLQTDSLRPPGRHGQSSMFFTGLLQSKGSKLFLIQSEPYKNTRFTGQHQPSPAHGGLRGLTIGGRSVLLMAEDRVYGCRISPIEICF